MKWPGNKYDMRAVTLWAPWGSAIVRGSKDVENRGWAFPQWLVGETIAIHNGKRWDDAAVDAWCEIDSGAPTGDVLMVDRGCIVGVARLVCCDPPGEGMSLRSRWRASDAYGWVLADRVALTQKISVRGAQGLWKVPRAVVESMRIPSFMSFPTKPSAPYYAETTTRTKRVRERESPR